MMIDFDRVSAEGGPFVLRTQEDVSAFEEWQHKCVCKHCGDKISDRDNDPIGTGYVAWLTETDCGCTSPKLLKDHISKMMIDAGYG